MRVGEWVECWLFGADPRRGRVRGVVTSMDSRRKEIPVSVHKRRPGYMFRMAIAKNSCYKGEAPGLYYDTEIIRRLTVDEIVAAKLSGLVEDEGWDCGL